jgi:hypothetical protein
VRNHAEGDRRGWSRLQQGSPNNDDKRKKFLMDVFLSFQILVVPRRQALKNNNPGPLFSVFKAR